MHGTLSPSGARFSTLLLALALGLSACGGPGASSSSRPLPSYAGHAIELYDDAIDPAAVGLDYQKSYAARSDARLRERTQVSDAVLRVRVATVTSKNDGPESTYQLGLHTLEPMSGKHPPPPDFTVRIDKSSESHGIMRNLESRLVGYSFVAFVREFVRPDGDSELHFHLAPDTKEVKAAVIDAIALQELK
jgi:hypothetical protein